MARRPASRLERGRAETGPVEDDRRLGLRLVPVSRETEEQFAVYADLLRRWQGIKNLVGPSTLAHVWTRHLADSAQLAGLAPDALRWADIGSGAGFPGLVIAIQLSGRPGAMVHLIESNARKCAFLREAARRTGAPALIHNGRAEEVLPTLEDVDVLTARALAPLPVLVELGKIPLERGASAIFLKSEAEIGAADLSLYRGETAVLPSKTSADGRIVLMNPRGSNPFGGRHGKPGEASGKVS